MNSMGRHYRDPSNPENPTCNYDTNGVKCTFFTSGHEHADIPYPSDISYGPVSDNTSEMAQILALLNQQRAEQQQQAQSVKQLQEQVSSLMLHNSTSAAPVPASTSQVTSSTATIVTTSAGLNNTNTSSSIPALSMIPTLPGSQFLPAQPTPAQAQNPTPIPSMFQPSIAQTPNQTPNSAPNSISAAASNLAASLQALLSSNGSYGGLTMDHLRQNPQVSSQASSVLASAIQDVAPLNQPGVLRNQVNSVDLLYKATTVNKQLRAYEFASTGQFSYHSQLKQDNVNAVAFAYGSFKHLEACKTGLIPNVTDLEFLARLRHLRNVFEIACLSSSLNSFSESAWHIAREYDTRVLSDIESGAKSWVTLSNGIEPDSIYCAKETVENRIKAKKVTGQNKDTKKDVKKDRKACTTYNTHRSSDGCMWEHQNKGETCVFEHFCSWCKQNRNTVEKHKAFNCEHTTD